MGHQGILQHATPHPAPVDVVGCGAPLPLELVECEVANQGRCGQVHDSIGLLGPLRGRRGGGGGAVVVFVVFVVRAGGALFVHAAQGAHVAAVHPLKRVAPAPDVHPLQLLPEPCHALPDRPPPCLVLHPLPHAFHNNVGVQHDVVLCGVQDGARLRQAECLQLAVCHVGEEALHERAVWQAGALGQHAVHHQRVGRLARQVHGVGRERGTLLRGAGTGTQLRHGHWAKVQAQAAAVAAVRTGRGPAVQGAPTTRASTHRLCRHHVRDVQQSHRQRRWWSVCTPPHSNRLCMGRPPLCNTLFDRLCRDVLSLLLAIFRLGFLTRSARTPYALGIPP